MFRWTEKEPEKKQAGKPIWEFLEKPSRISLDLKKSELELKVQTGENDKKRILLFDRVLFEINKNGISFPTVSQNRN